MKKMWFMVISAFTLLFYLKLDNIQAAFDWDIMGVEILSLEEIDIMCEGKEDVFLYPCITLEDDSIAYDSSQNMLLIPQSLEEKDFLGRLKVPDGKLYFLEDGAFENKAEAISQNKVFRLFWARDGQCWMYNVYFTGMPVLNLTTTEQYEEESRGTVWVYDQYREDDNCRGLECTWHIRGDTTRNYEKAGYKLELTNRKVSLLGMRKDDDWILNALYDDDGLIHNKLSYDVWNRIAGSNYVRGDEGINMEYVEVFIDDEYCGVYGLTERIDKKQLSLNDRDKLYKCCGSDLPGEDDFYESLTDEMDPVFVMKYPSKFTSKDWEPLRQWTSLFLTDRFEDYPSGKEILNMENAIDYNIFNLLTCGMDNTMKNIYFWADYQQDGSYQFIKIPWDLNMTWGNSWVDDISYKFNKYQTKNLNSPDGWTEDIYELFLYDPQEIGYLMRKRWQELRNGIIDKEILAEMVNSQYDYLHSSGAYLRNEAKWPSEEIYWQDEYIFEYIENRIDFLDEYIGQMGQ